MWERLFLWVQVGGCWVSAVAFPPAWALGQWLLSRFIAMPPVGTYMPSWELVAGDRGHGSLWGT